ncbi:hypothetical protein COV18_03580 [Candidatus Woesearchaeota archaeon CG10_big_fil_rev_8_21_14_0_10_37_12]|nr:MAG: hypothetical protein COV18_03580 [Candidatus Woesearchaeota archaeon CG10_big_fil_rev_8_21_14_0_10_37_12]
MIKKCFFLTLFLSVTVTATPFDFDFIQQVTGNGWLTSCFTNGNRGGLNIDNSPIVLKLDFPYTIEARSINAHWGMHHSQFNSGIGIYRNGQRINYSIAAGGTKNEPKITPWVIETGDEVKRCAFDFVGRGKSQFRIHYDDWWVYTIPGFVYDLVSNIWVHDRSWGGPENTGTYWINLRATHTANITFGEKQKNLGTIQELARPYLLDELYNPGFYAESDKPEILFEITTQVLACLDMDLSNACDYEQADACSGAGGDWASYYDPQLQATVGTCCGITPTHTPDTCQYSQQFNTLCGKNNEQNWQFASLSMPGIIKNYACPEKFSTLSTGTELYACGNNPYGLQNMQKITVLNHEFICVPDQKDIYECIGNNTFPLVTNNPFREQGEHIVAGSTTYECQENATWTTYHTPCLLGEQRINNETGLIEFCSPTQGWITDLDADEGACRAAGRLYNTIRWTGTQCCGDPLDNNTPQAIYEEQNGLGACLNNTPIMSGQTITNNTIINHQGQFYQCQGTPPSTELQNAGITPAHQGVCGQPLLNTTSSIHSICLPNGKWYQTPYTTVHQVKSINWQPLATQINQGCCPENKCWDGNTCKNPGEYYQIENQGYQCQN